MITLIWDRKQKAIKEIKQNKLSDTDNSRVVTREEGEFFLRSTRCCHVRESVSQVAG